MTTYEKISSLLSFAALLGVIFSLLLVGAQLRHMQKQSEEMRRDVRLSAETALDGLFVVATETYLQFPALRPVFNESESDSPVGRPEGDLLWRANALAENLADAMERALGFERDGVPGVEGLLTAWIRDSFADSMFFRTWLSSHRAWYSAELMQIVDEATETVRPPPPRPCGQQSD